MLIFYLYQGNDTFNADRVEIQQQIRVKLVVPSVRCGIILRFLSRTDLCNLCWALLI